MGLLSVDGNLLRKMIIAGSNELSKNRDLVDSLNVFPVPDGDTGTNMSLTCLAAAKEVEKLNTPNIYDVAKAASSGSLRGARGNSGVILSQLFRGFANGLKGVETATIEDFSRAFVCATETAYKAVMKPKEGTILTVAKAIGQSSIENILTTNIEENFKEIIFDGNEMLLKTTDMLKELKQAGVVDSGGKGLLCILEGAFNALNSDEDIKIITEESTTHEPMSNNFEINVDDIKFTYCTEFFINVKSGTGDEVLEGKLKSFMQNHGDSIVVVADDDIVKIHIHTNHPGQIMEKALTFGELSNLKIENMKLQHSNLINFNGYSQETTPVKEDTPKTEYGLIAMAVGDGIVDLFKEMGVDKIIHGGQTMNPSTDEILNSINEINAENIYIFPNNKNIILSAEQAAELCTDKKVFVVTTTTIPQGIAGIINFMPTNSPTENLESMNEAAKMVTTGQVTYAVRKTVIDDIDIEENDILAMVDGKIKHVGKEIFQSTMDLIDILVNEDSELITILYGEETTEDDAKLLEVYINEKYPFVDIELQSGGQPLYYYIIGVE